MNNTSLLYFIHSHVVYTLLYFVFDKCICVNKYILDSEDRRKIKVEIKPYSPHESVPSNNVDDLKRSIEGLRLSPSAMVCVACVCVGGLCNTIV